MTDLATVFSDLVRYQITLWNAVDVRLKTDLDFSLANYETLRAIDSRDTCRVLDVADELVITVGGASKIVDRLEAQGLCARRPNPDDRRSSIVSVTPAGERALHAARRTVEDELQKRLGSPLTVADLDRFADTLSALRASTRHAGTPAAPTPEGAPA
ncbi:MarR family winged helix-turn-helix transcriptional regulator [Frondihabitans cladoniiphilus]|uniref:MarR family winged helix-turn-helix transcriptional regulator n=1 Tax=Frondihabitans cladoniiphilus TaxID=715785 RepID=A0ABP8VPT9_9MICO